MKSIQLLRRLMLYTLVPIVILSSVSGIYLYQIVLSDKLSDINRYNLAYEEFLSEKAANALATSDYPYFQNIIDSLVAKDSSGIESIELINTQSNKEIVASSPAIIPFDQPAKKVNVYGVSFIGDRFNAKDTKSTKVGYLLIRYDGAYVQHAINHVVFYFLVLSFITFVLMMIVYYKVKQLIIVPYNEIKNNLVALKDDDLMSAGLEDAGGNEIYQMIIDVKNNLHNKALLIDILKNKVHRSKNETNEARLSQFEMIGELVDALERKVEMARKLIAKLLDGEISNELKHSYYLLSGTVDEITRSLNDSKKLIDNPFADYTPDPIRLGKMYDNVCNSIISSNYSLYTTKNIKSKLLPAFVLADNVQIQLLIEKILSMAAKISVRNDLYISMLAEEISEDNLSISIEIKDSSNGMSEKEAENINKFINNADKEIETDYFNKADLKIIKHLKQIPGLSVNIYPDNGRGNFYRVSLECEYSMDEKELCTNDKAAFVHVVKVQEDPEVDLLKEHYRMINIDMNYIQFYEIETQIEYVVNQDIIILDFSTNVSKAMEIYGNLTRYDCSVIAVVNDDQLSVSNQSYIIDELFDRGIADTLLSPYSPERLKESVEKIFSANEYKVKDLVDSLKEKYKD